MSLVKLNQQTFIQLVALIVIVSWICMVFLFGIAQIVYFPIVSSSTFTDNMIKFISASSLMGVPAVIKFFFK